MSEPVLTQLHRTRDYAEVTIVTRDGREAWAGNLTKVDPRKYTASSHPRTDAEADQRDYEHGSWLAQQIIEAENDDAKLNQLESDWRSLFHRIHGAVAAAWSARR